MLRPTSNDMQERNAKCEGRRYRKSKVLGNCHHVAIPCRCLMLAFSILVMLLLQSDPISIADLDAIEQLQGAQHQRTLLRLYFLFER